MKASVSQKGQVTIPKPLRDTLGIRPGSVIEFNARNGMLIGRKSESAEDPILAVTGIVKLPRGVDDYLTAIRGKAR